MLKKELEKELKLWTELAEKRKAENRRLETQVKQFREQAVRLEVINRDNTDALKASTIYIKMLLRNQYT